MNTKFYWTLLLLNLLVLVNCSSSQGKISGLVRDYNGPVAGAIVRIQTTELFTTTDGEGNFTIAGLSQANPVTLTAWASGYYIVGGETAYLPGANDIELVLIPHTEIDNPNYEWLSAFASEGDPSNCQNCHSQPDDQEPALGSSVGGRRSPHSV